MLQYGAEWGELYGHGVYDSEAGAFYLPKVNMDEDAARLDDDEYLIDGMDVQLPIKVAGYYSTFGDEANEL